MPTDIIIVDDDPDVRAFLHLAISREGFDVRSATGAREALGLVRERKPDVMILDLMMPEMTGEELCAALKMDRASNDIIVFILSAQGDVQTKLRCFESGADEYLVKPVDPQEITARIERSLRLRRPGRPSGREKEVAQSSAEAREARRVASAQTQQLQYGPYAIEGLVGSGGMGQVFKGVDALLERPVAIKVLSKQVASSDEFVQRFRREARLLASISHPGIATIYSFGTEGDDLYFTMEWCSGGSLADLIYRKKRIPVDEALDYVLQCAHSLNAASRKGIVHRDIKPSNLMFDDNRRIKLVDFGIAFSGQDSIHSTDASEILGTPLYMSPEQAKGQNIDHRADIYSLGIVFFYMLYGKTPFSGENPMDIILQHATQPLPDYQDLAGAVPYRVYSTIERMTRKDPAARYQDYEELILDLDRVRKTLSLSPVEDSTLTEIPLRDLVERIGVYLLEGEVGRGSTARIYKAYDSETQRYAAVTVFSGAWCAMPGFMENLQQRIQILRNLKNPGIGTIYDFGRESGEIYVAQEWCPGGSVARLVRTRGRLGPQSSIALLLQMARALSAAAGAGILHGRLRPNHILLDENQGIKITDLSWANAVPFERSRDESGVHRFAAPERSALLLDVRADIYSLGITLYYMLYGIIPDNPEAGMKALPPYEDLGGSVPRELYDAAEKMTASDPESRYDSYPSLIQDLERLQAEILSRGEIEIPEAQGAASQPLLSGTFMSVLSEVYRRGLSGILTVRWSVLETRLLVRQREVVLFESNQPAKNIWRFMAKERSIRKEEVPEKQEGLRAGLHSLLEQGACTTRDFVDSYRRLMKQVVEEVFIWPVGETDFLQASIENRAFTALRISDVLLEAARHALDIAAIRRMLSFGGRIQRTAQFEHLLSSFDLSPSESFLAYRVEDTDTTLESLQMLTGFPEEQILRLMFLLERIGAVRLL